MITTETTEPLPELYEAVLDGALFEALFDDLARVADVLSVHLKSTPEARSEEAPITLDAARLQLVLGRAHGVRIRYRHAGDEWIDTIMCLNGAMRLIRMRVPAPPRPAKPRLEVLR